MGYRKDFFDDPKNKTKSGLYTCVRCHKKFKKEDIDVEHSADAEKFFADAVIVSGKNYSKVIHDLARTYTDKIMEKLADGSAEDGFAPIASGTDTSVGTQALNSVLYLADTEFDGVPELFAGVSGTVGSGKYDF